MGGATSCRQKFKSDGAAGSRTQNGPPGGQPTTAKRFLKLLYALLRGGCQREKPEGSTRDNVSTSVSTQQNPLLPLSVIPLGSYFGAQKNVRQMRTRSFENLVEGRRFELPTS